MPAPFVRLGDYSECGGWSGCFSSRIVLWQSLCGCWVSKCVRCGIVGYADCGDQYEEHDEDGTHTHWDLFEMHAEAIT